MIKPKPERVNMDLLVLVLQTGEGRQVLWRDYVQYYCRITGKLTPDCDERDFYAALDQLVGQKRWL